MNEWISQFICVNNCTGDSAVVGGGLQIKFCLGPPKGLGRHCTVVRQLPHPDNHWCNLHNNPLYSLPQDRNDNYVTILFVDFSSAPNTIIPQWLVGKQNPQTPHSATVSWTREAAHDQVAKLSTGVPQGCVLSPLLFTLLNTDSNWIVKVVVRDISNNKSANRAVVKQLVDCCHDNSPSLNVDHIPEHWWL